jgi:hypothetical protein
MNMKKAVAIYFRYSFFEPYFTFKLAPHPTWLAPWGELSP